jgi:nucleoside-diphosphate-sugar epimerase
MILVISGLNGFIGSNTTEALRNLVKNCVVTRHENTEIPGFLQKHIDHKRVFIEAADATSISDLRKIGEKHKIDGIVNIAGGFASGEGPLRGLKGSYLLVAENRLYDIVRTRDYETHELKLATNVDDLCLYTYTFS